MGDDRPEWDAEKASALIGRRVVVGLTFRAKDGGLEQHQMQGLVSEASPEAGILIALKGKREGETYRLPPDPAAFFPAAPGEYRLRTTGEVIVNPDFTSTWTIDRPE